jgi:hypothetical protein
VRWQKDARPRVDALTAPTSNRMEDVPATVVTRLVTMEGLVVLRVLIKATVSSKECDVLVYTLQKVKDIWLNAILVNKPAGLTA